MAQGMQYLHDELHVAHRDLKHQNILMGLQSADPRNEEERQPTVKVCDFTTAVDVPPDPGTLKVSIKSGTMPFNAPE